MSIAATLGGDKIGKRPVDFHIRGLQEMGATVVVEDGTYHMSVGDEGLHGAHIIMPFPSVMTTENLIITAVMARGRTIIENAATEPEILELVKMLQRWEPISSSMRIGLLLFKGSPNFVAANCV